MSLGLYGNQNYHGYLRLKTALEIVRNASTYSSDSPTLVLRDLPILTPDYRQLVRETPVNSSYAEMIHLFALSKALRIAIQSYCCPAPDSSIHPYTMHINQSSYDAAFNDGSVTVMCTISSMTATTPNHFALLAPCQADTTATPTSNPASPQSAADNVASDASGCESTVETDNSDTDDATDASKVAIDMLLFARLLNDIIFRDYSGFV